MCIKYKQFSKLSAFSLTFLLCLSGYSLTVSSAYISYTRPLFCHEVSRFKLLYQ